MEMYYQEMHKLIDYPHPSDHLGWKDLEQEYADKIGQESEWGWTDDDYLLVEGTKRWNRDKQMRFPFKVMFAYEQPATSIIFGYGGDRPLTTDEEHGTSYLKHYCK
jgi:hypothetical protein